MGCTEPPNTGIKESVEAIDDVSNLQSMLINDDGLSNLLELHLEAKNLKNMDAIGLSDPMVVVFSAGKNNTFSEIGRTEMIRENLNPVFIKAVIFKYLFEEKQKIRFEVYDVDNESANLKDQDFIGSCIIEPHEIIRAPKQKLTRQLERTNNEKSGELIVTAETISKKMSANLIIIEFEGNIKLKEPIFIKLFRQKASDSPEFIPVYQSETQISTGSIAKWKKIKVGAASLIKDDLSSNIKIEIFHFSRTGNHKKVGEKVIMFKNFLETKPSIYFGDNSSSEIRTSFVTLEERFSFVEYLFNGLNISMILAIDFTGSNGDPSSIDSLHYFDPNKNQYISAITSVGTILECYDSDKMIPTIGFGARMQGLGTVTSHCFALNGNIFAPEVFGIKGVLNLYRNNLRKLNFSGPTHFSPFLNYAVNTVNEYIKHGILNTFFVVMIITDGEIHDMNETIDEIVRASSLPMSIIIVGVGNEDFKNMEALDADKNPLVSNRYGKMKNDIVQFVPLREYIHSPQQLASETLKELPQHVSNYMKLANLNPKNFVNMSNPANFNFNEFLKEEFLSSHGANDQNILKAISIGIPTLEEEFRNSYNNPYYSNVLTIN